MMKPGTLWVPKNIVRAMVQHRLGQELDCLSRCKSLQKSAFSLPEARPLPANHFETLRVERGLIVPHEILLVDDVVTSGSTFLGAANRLLEAFPEARVRAFAMIRTISDPEEFRAFEDPHRKFIIQKHDGRAWRQ